MEAQGPLFRRGVPTLQTSLTLPELPCTATAILVCENVSRFFGGGCRTGKFFVGLGGRILSRCAASRVIGGRGAFGDDAIHECRDSACRRPFGVRRNAAGVCSEMTRRLGALWDITYSWQCCYLLIYDYDAIHKCRDSACWRPFGVRLRGSS